LDFSILYPTQQSYLLIVICVPLGLVWKVWVSSVWGMYSVYLCLIHYACNWIKQQSLRQLTVTYTSRAFQ